MPIPTMISKVQTMVDSPGEGSAHDGQRQRFQTEGTRHECGASPRSPSLPVLSEEAVEGAGHETSEDVQRVRDEQAASLVQVEVPFPSLDGALIMRK